MKYYIFKKSSKYFKTIKVKNVRECLGQICSKFYDKNQKYFLVTGTNGKFSCGLFSSAVNSNGFPVATIGTLGIKTKHYENNLTSPDVISLHKELSNLKKN